ncbi:sensor histidine kinase [Nonomuraea sediminis]|uniref:sensor histidine kinase n=1 Tax=Nonomuraea sediminis TaxID=2835864 RepID=UPI0027E19C01|nr:HAMP domain-containing sensor histidine kinase [Nonomuraea sediminis]
MFTRWSVRRRLTLVTLLTTLAGFLLIALVVTPLVHALVTSYVTDQAATAARRVSYGVQRYAPDNLKPVVATEEVDLVQVVDNQGAVRQASIRLLGKPPLTRVLPRDADSRVDSRVCTGGTCLIVVGYRVGVGSANWMVYTYVPEIPWYISIRYIIGVLAGSVLMSAIIAAVCWMVVRKALEPVKTMKNELAEITETDLGRRVPPTAHQDELDDLAKTINDTLDRLEGAVEQQRRFASDASHDLRSPITAMRAQVEDALMHPEDADWQGTGQALLTSLDRLQAIVTDLLTLARLDAGAPGRNEPLDLAVLVEEELARRPRGKQVNLGLAPGVAIQGDRLRLARLLTNLLDNAERHADATITVSVFREGGMAVLEVEDDGAGIPLDQRELVFRRFTRLDASRNVDAGGTGLGLAIAREVARAHGGSLTIEDSEVGARFVLHIPISGS